jgi:hypothetical protein
MEKPVRATVEEHFGSITDPRIERTKLHKLIDILVIAICAAICGCDNWEDIALFGEAKQEWFATFSVARELGLHLGQPVCASFPRHAAHIIFPHSSRAR